jgi:uncharacterized protein (TIGR03435 family)
MRRRILMTAAVIVLSVAFVFALALTESPLRAQSPAAERPKFEVASVKPCGSGGGRGAGGTPPPQWSPGRLTVTCQPVRMFIDWAYISYADGQQHLRGIAADAVGIFTPIEGGPSWLDSERFTISAEVPGDASQPMMMGPMMQSLLEDRFQLKIHSETREVSVYDLTVAKGGPKLPETDPETVCRNWYDPKTPPRKPGDPPDCTMDTGSISMSDFSEMLRLPMGRPVIDKTGITGSFAIRMTFGPPPGTPEGVAWQAGPDAPSIFTAMKEQLGLELVPAKGPDKVLVIDHIEEPSAN